MRDMPTQKYMFPVNHDKSSRPADRPSARPGRDPDHEARKLLAGEIEAAILFNNKHICNPGKLTPAERGAVAQAIRVQAARKRPRSERKASPARKYLSAQIELLLSVYECRKIHEVSSDFGPPSVWTEPVGRLVEKIDKTIKYIKETEDVAK